MQFNSPVSIKSNNTFILSELLMNGLYFLTHVSYNINALNISCKNHTSEARNRTVKYNV